MQPKTVLITGCSSGIGRATALAFADEGWTVYATARDPADIETLEDAGCRTDRLDVTEQDDIDRVVDRILDEEGAIGCLVNNAGFGQFGSLEDVPVEKVAEQYEVNVYGPHRLIRAVLPHMRREEEGTIVNVSSVAGRVAFPGGSAYCGSKFALEAMSDALRAEVEPFGVDVVVVEPGPVRTSFSDRAEAEADGNDRTGAYEDFYSLFDDTEAIGGDGPGSVSPERVAEDIVNAASATKPVARVPVGTAARVSVLARFIPDTIRDQLWSVVRRFT
ncbi:SDR family oxidoreductase [Halohasta salina]|uniref:SDR family oxidoreductase n=1 Tax=Halohasta salina TaxID=2961621 RepID=UPI0020A5603B|nr:SDR family NAD(P)-dependent oxidoreductase [Halohasta salina]